jgi:hypothetical protein
MSVSIPQAILFQVSNGSLYQRVPSHYSQRLLIPLPTPNPAGSNSTIEPVPVLHLDDGRPHGSYCWSPSYGIGIVAGKAYFKNRSPWNWRGAMSLWNLGLSVFSAIGFVRVALHSTHSCHQFHATGTLYRPRKYLWIGKHRIVGANVHPIQVPVSNFRDVMASWLLSLRVGCLTTFESLIVAFQFTISHFHLLYTTNTHTHTQGTLGYTLYCRSQETSHLLASVPSHYRLAILLAFVCHPHSEWNFLRPNELRCPFGHVFYVLPHGH